MKNKLFQLIAACAIALSCVSCGIQKLDTSHLYTAAATGLQALTLSNDQLLDYVSQSVTQMDAQSKVAPADSPYTKRLNRLTAGLTHVNKLPLKFKVYETPEVNAFACADGNVRVYTGIMDLMTDDELLGIIGHEIGHVAMEHSKNAFKQELINNALLEVAASANGTIAALTQSQLADLAKTYVSAKFSRKQENEADEFGYQFLKGAGKNPYAMVLAFEKMQKLENSNPGQSSYFQKMFSSHPETTQRIAHIKSLCDKDGFKRPTGK